MNENRHPQQPLPRKSRAGRVTAHRGASARAPENTLAAVRLALRLGADAVECDVHRTRDGALVVIHDRHLRRTTDAQQRFPGRAAWRVKDFTLAEIKRLDAGAWFGIGYAGETVPTLSEWAAVVGDRARMLVEVKHPTRYPGIGADLAGLLRADPQLAAALAGRRLVLQSFDHAWLARFRERVADVELGLLYESRPDPVSIAAAARFAQQVNPGLHALDREVVRRIQGVGLEVHVWTPNTRRELRHALRCGVDGVITDHPERPRLTTRWGA